MKKIIFFISLVLCLILVGCGSSNIDYDGNLGLDFSKTKAENIVFRAYHSNTKDHIWEKIASFDINPKSKKSYDISLKAEGENIIISALEWDAVSKEKEKETYNSKILGFTDAFIDGFEGDIAAHKTFGVENISGEQYYKLFPISNDDNASFFENISLNAPYDIDGGNLDNILITVEIK